MKFKVTMKDPDVLDDACTNAAALQVAGIDGLDEEEQETLEESKKEKLKEIASKWFEYGEYLTVEIDTDAGTCVVVPN